MSTLHIALITAVIGSGAFTGVIAAMAGVIQWMLNGLEYREYRLAMHGIIVQGRRSPIIWLLLLLPLGAAALSSVLLWQQDNLSVFWLTIAGLGTFIAGPILASRFLNEPFYDQVMKWEPDSEPANWQKMRMTWFYYNLIRMLIAALASVFFAIALLNS